MTESQKKAIAYFMDKRDYFNFNKIEIELGLYQAFFHFLKKKYDKDPDNYKVKKKDAEKLEAFYNRLIKQNETI